MLFSSVTFTGQKCFVNENNRENNVILYQNSNNLEEFTTYWYSDFRQTPTCDVTYKKFSEMLEKYNALSEEEKAIVNVLPADENNPTETYTILDVINTLKNKFNTPSSSGDGDKPKLDQGTMIAVVSGVAIFGITTILIFYILKNKKIIK